MQTIFAARREHIPFSTPLINTLVAAVAAHSVPDALRVIDEMLRVQLTPDARTYLPLLRTCLRVADDAGVRSVLQHMETHRVAVTPAVLALLLPRYAERGDRSAVDRTARQLRALERPLRAPSAVALIRAYAACGDFDAAQAVLADLRATGVVRTAAHYTPLLVALALAGRGAYAVSLLALARADGVSAMDTLCAAVVQALVKAGAAELACEVEDRYLSSLSAAPSVA